MTSEADAPHPDDRPSPDPQFVQAWVAFTGEVIRVSIPERYRRAVKLAAERFADGVRRIPW